MSGAMRTTTLDGQLMLAVYVDVEKGWLVRVSLPCDSDNMLRRDWARLGVSLLGARLQDEGWGMVYNYGYATRTASGRLRNGLAATCREVDKVVEQYRKVVAERQAWFQDAGLGDVPDGRLVDLPDTG